MSTIKGERESPAQNKSTKKNPHVSDRLRSFMDRVKSEYRRERALRTESVKRKAKPKKGMGR